MTTLETLERPSKTGNIIKLENAQVRQALYRAHDIIEERGLAKGTLIDVDNGQVCLVGALVLAADWDVALTQTLFDAVRNFIKSHFGEFYISAFSDHNAQDKVLMTLDYITEGLQ